MYQKKETSDLKRQKIMGMILQNLSSDICEEILPLGVEIYMAHTESK